MAANTIPITPASIDGGSQTFVNADGTTTKTVYTAGANGTRIDSIIISSTDTAAQNIILYLYDGTNTIPLGTIPIAAGAGTTTTQPSSINGLDTAYIKGLDPSGSLFLKASTWVLKAAMFGAVTAAKTVYVSAIGGAY